MWDLLKEYKLVDWDISPHITEQERIVRNKRLFAPFGVDPYPCADENGLEQPELWAAFLVEYDRKKKESWERGKARYEAECKATNQEWKLEAFPYADEDDPCWE